MAEARRSRVRGDRPLDLSDSISPEKLTVLPPEPTTRELWLMIQALAHHIQVQRSADDTALDLQAREYERRLDGLNGEQTRIAATQATYVGREIWDRFLQEDRTWKNRTDLAIADRLPRQEFQAHKEATDRALQLKAGETRGAGNLWALIGGGIFLLVAVGGLLASFLTRGTP